MIKLYRLSRKKFAYDLSGTGARLHGGRWNSKGVNMVYTSENISLANLEVAVHLDLDLIPDDYCLIEIEVPKKSSCKIIKLETLKKYWNSYPHGNETQLLGDDFIQKNKFLLLKVPSAVVLQEHNFLLNPNHEDFKNVKVTKVTPFTFNDRLFSV